MSPSTRLFRAAGVAVLTAILSAPVFAQTATTDPVGFVTVNIAGNSDSYTYIPFKRTPEYSGAISTVSGNLVVVAGTPNFTSGQFVYAAGTQPKTYYLLLTSGPKVGMYYTITANSTNTVTVDTAGDSISGISGNSFNIIPFDTLGSIFPNGQGINGSSDHTPGNRQAIVLIPDTSTAGTNLAAAKSFYYYTGGTAPGAGWRRVGSIGDFNVIVNDTVLYPDVPLIIRNNVSTPTSVTYMGTVHMGTVATPVGTIAANRDQDNAVALPIASNLTLAETKLYESGAFVGSATHSPTDRKDILLVWDNSIPGRNKAADRSYYYYTGAVAPGAGWRKVGTIADFNTIVDNTVVFTPNTGLAIRKKGSPSPSTTVWADKAPYVPATNP